VIPSSIRRGAFGQTHRTCVLLFSRRSRYSPIERRCGRFFSGFRFARFALAALLLAVPELAHAQEPFPGEPPNAPAQPSQPAPAPAPPTAPARDLPSQQDPGPPTLRVTTNVVLVPTLVEQKNGSIVYGLKPNDFSRYDNGVAQKVRVDEDMDLAPVSMVVCVERGRDAALIMDKVAQLPPLLDLFTGGRRGQVALVTFDSAATYLDEFSSDPTYVDEDLQRLPPGDGGAAIMDAVGFSLDLLDHQPANQRKILLLVSESRDHGSHKVTIPQLVERIGTSNTLVLSLVFSPAKAELRNWGNASGGLEMNLFAPLVMTYNAMRKNMPKTLAELSGGEYAPFTRDKTFQNAVVELSNHAHNRYLLSFHPSDLTPGLHTLDVKLNEDLRADVIARTSYWATSPDGSPVPPPAQ
jgi:VWFA-related protein